MNDKIRKKVQNNQYQTLNNQQRISNKGITLVALIITIVVLVILATVSIQAISGEGIFKKARETKFKAEMAQLQEDLGVYVAEKQILYRNNFHAATLSASKNGISYETALGVEKQEGDIESVLPSISKKRKEQIEIIKGEILFSSQNKNELKWAQELGIGINPYNIVNGVLMSSETNLMLMGEDGVLAIPTSVTKIADGAFGNVTGIKKVIIPGNVKVIGKNAFSNNSTLEIVMMEDGVETIESQAFQDCHNLKKVMMPDTVTQMSSQIFYRDSKLENVTLSNGLTQIQDYTFGACTTLKDIVVPEGVTRIGIEAFAICGFTQIKLPESLITIDRSAFANCTQLTTINIPKDVTSIGTGVFSGCTKLSNVTVDGENTNFASVQSILMNKEKTNMIWVSSASPAIHNGTFTIPNNVTTVASGLINGYTNINKVVIPASVTSLNADFFTSYVKSVEIDSLNTKYESDGKAVYSKGQITLYKYITPESSIKLPDTLKNIGASAFSFMKETVTSIKFPDSLETIGNAAFSGCTNLTTVNFGSKLKSMSSYPFEGSSITTVTINDLNPNYTVEGKGIYNKDQTTLCYVYGKDSTFTVNEKTKKVKEQAFWRLTSLVSVDLKNVEEIGVQGFAYCNKLTNITMNKVKRILGSETFRETALTTLDIPSSIESIGANAFGMAGRLTKITIHKKKDSISGAPWGAVQGERAIEWVGE